MKLLTTAAAGLILVQSIVTPAHALVGGGMALFGAAAAGTVAWVGGGMVGGGFLAVELSPDTCAEDCYFAPMGAVLGILAGMVGVIVLDQSQGGAPTFAALTPEQGATLGLAAEKVAVYNQEISEINAIRETVSGELSAMASQGESISTQVASQHWAAYSNALSPESIEVMHAVVAQAVTARR